LTNSCSEVWFAPVSIHEGNALTQESFKIISPVDGSTLAVLPYASTQAVDEALSCARASLASWRRTPLSERIAVVERFLDALGARRAKLAELITWQMGRPLQQADEFDRVQAQAIEMIALAPKALADVPLAGSPGIRRSMRREPKGVFLAICAWNYPLAMASDMVISALLAGNVVILKHAAQTALLADEMVRAFEESGCPKGVFQSLHLAHPLIEKMVAAGEFQGLQFIGSERGGREVLRASAAGLIAAGMELGGKDPAYVRADADVEWTVQQLVEGSFGNSGQSCCSVERIYVNRDIHDRFVECFVDAASKLKLGNPLAYPDLGPVVSVAAACRIAEEVAAAVACGAKRALSKPAGDGLAGTGAYLAPEVLISASHDMSIMRDETFGPVVPIMAVPDDEAAMALMNDSRYGLTASVWSRDIGSAQSLVARIDAGTVFVNRCDHADVLLPWGGTKASGIGRRGGPMAFDELTQVKSFHVRETP